MAYRETIGGKQVIQKLLDKKKVSETEIKSLNSAPLEIIPAPGVGRIVAISDLIVRFIFRDSAYTSGNLIVRVQNGGDEINLGDILTATATEFRVAVPIVPIENQGVELFVEGADPTGGNSVIEVYAVYSNITLLEEPGDETPPELLEASVDSDLPGELRLIMSESVNLTTAGWSVGTDSATAINVTGVTGDGNNNPTLILDRDIEPTETLTVSYDDTGLTDAEKTKDLSGNLLANISSDPVVNNVLPKLNTPTISLSNRTTSSITVSWTNVSNENGYRLQISDDGGSTWPTEIDLGVDVVSYQDTGLSSGQTKHYRVRALGDDVNFTDSDWSNILEATTNAEQLATPTNFDAIAGGSDVIDLFWNDNNTNESGYELQISTDGGATYNPLTTLPENTTSHQDTGLTGGTEYFYRLRATGDGVSYTNSNWTVASATTDTSTTSSSVGEGAVGEAAVQ